MRDKNPHAVSLGKLRHQKRYHGLTQDEIGKLQRQVAMKRWRKKKR